MAPYLARVDVRQVHFDGGKADGRQGVGDGVRIVGVGAGVDLWLPLLDPRVDQGDVVTLELLIAADDGQTFHAGGRDDQAIERVAMMHGQRLDRLSVFERYGKLLKRRVRHGFRRLPRCP